MIATQPAYWAEPLTWEFEARIIRKTNVDHSQFEVIREKSYFYPTGGANRTTPGL